MSEEKVVEALRKARVACGIAHGNAARLGDAQRALYAGQLSDYERRKHIAFMCEEAERMLIEGRREKVMRWLGFVQGALWTSDLVTIEDAKEANRPQEPGCSNVEKYE